MIVRITIFSESGTVFSYLSRSDYFQPEMLPIEWNEDQEVPDLVANVLENFSQSDEAPPFVRYEALRKVVIEENHDKHWLNKKAV